MTLLQALFLGILQGFTEFLPVSSSGHLVFAESVLNIHIPVADLQGMNVLMHAGTLLALLIVYADVWINLAMAPLRNDDAHSRQLVLLVIATIPGAFFGFFLEDAIAQNSESLLSVGIAFAVTGIVLILGERSGRVSRSVWHRILHPTAHEPRKLSTRSAFFIGIAQAFALVPGVSRSGVTISAGRMMGLERKDALDFSFLMAVPIIAGASAKSLLDVFSGQLVLPSVAIVSTAVTASFICSIAAILFLRSFVISRSLAWFSPYLFVLSGIAMLMSA